MLLCSNEVLIIQETETFGIPHVTLCTTIKKVIEMNIQFNFLQVNDKFLYKILKSHLS